MYMHSQYKLIKIVNDKFAKFTAQPYVLPCSNRNISCLWSSIPYSPFKDLGKKIKHNTGDQNATQYLWQLLSIAIQRGHAASILGCMPHIDELA